MSQTNQESSMFSFMKENGYIWETQLSGHLTYGPFGKKLKTNLENFLRRVFERDGFEEIETPLISSRDLWEKTTHWTKFQDFVVEFQIKDKKGNKKGIKKHKVEEVLEWLEYNPLEYDLKLSEEHHSRIKEILSKNLEKLNQHYGGEPILPEKFTSISLMMKSVSGNQDVGLRPETASSTFANYFEYLNHYKQQFPIKIYQIGKSFRNEANSHSYLLRSREFTQGEFQFIYEAKNRKEVPKTLSQLKADSLDLMVQVDDQKLLFWDLELQTEYLRLYLFLTLKLFHDLGIPSDRIRLHRHSEADRAFYALEAYDVEVKLSRYGWTEIAGVHDRGSYDLSVIFEKELAKKKKKGLVPNVIEVAIGIDRLFYSLVDSWYQKKDKGEGKTILQIPYQLAPVQVAILPLVKNKDPQLVQIAHDLETSLSRFWRVKYNDKSSIGNRYLRNAMMGIPYSVTVDFDSIPNQDVTVRDRDTEDQIRVPISDLKECLESLFSGNKTMNDFTKVNLKKEIKE